ncbi:uncharacterized protein [Coffea arabica]|uniref:Uncharacterized protein isoform X1 n=2 Tax=Coffea arabica TaxID=13443 RepID=A0A6P6WY08_COFAR|nr:uncharacterized protein LOC113736695 isoform X1 [Coffea arabica]
MSEIKQEQPMEFDIDNLFEWTMKKNWKEVLNVCRNNPSACMAKLTKSEDTALHIAVSSFHADQIDANGQAKVVSDLVESLPPDQAVEILKVQNDKGDTPLHLAAALGSATICICIARKDHVLISERNLKGETPLFMAAHHGKMEAFLQLHKLYRKSAEEPDDRLYRRNDGDTILHSAISGEYFALAYQIISYNHKLVRSINQEGFSPLHILARKPNVFESSSNLRLFDRIIYRCVLVRELKKQKFKDSGINYPDNYQTCVKFIHLPWAAFRTITALGKDCGPRQEPGSKADAENPKNEEEEHQEKELKDEHPFPENYTTCIQLFKFAMNVVLVVLGIGIWKISKIREKKERHKWAVQVMDKLIEHEANYKYSHNGGRPVDNVEQMYPERIKPPSTPPPEHDTYSSSEDTGSKSKDKQEHEDGIKLDAQTKDVKETRIVAANMDIKETVKKILETFPAIIQDLDANAKNALLLTVNLAKMQDPTTKDVKKETPILLAAKMGVTEVVKKILETFPVAIQDLDANEKNALLLAVENRQNKVFDLLMMMKLPEFVLYQVDNEGNSALHLAAKFQEHQPWRIPGAALQMQWEIKWYKHVKHSMPPQCFIQYNKKGETAGKIFMKTHEKLVKDGSKWMIKTSESCSLVAALIATVAFATSSTIPGGPDQKSGHPVLEKQPAFNVFSVASLVALCFSVTALVFFLAILTSRCQKKDFKKSLPRKLLFGLTSLFTSISAVLVSFCAGHFFMLSDQIHSAALPLYAVACLPITFFAFAQLPLYFDLLWSIIRKVPVRSYKVYYH